MNSIKDFTNRELQLMDIHKLRDLARSVGVNSPTSKKKGDLVQDILDIVTGKVLPEYKNINRGRPAKNNAVKLVINREPSSVFADNVFALNSYAASPTEEYKVDGTLTGVISLNKDGATITRFKFTKSSSDIQLPSTVVEKYGLKENDVVSYISGISGVTITAINGKQVLNKSKQLGGKNIVTHAKNILFVNSASEKQQILDGLAVDSKVVYLPSSFVLDVKSPSVIKIATSQDITTELINSFCASLDVALFYSSTGCNVVVLADNFLTVITAIKQTEQGAELESQLLAKLEVLVAGGATFVGLVPDSLKNVFTNLSLAFDNID